MVQMMSKIVTIKGLELLLKKKQEGKLPKKGWKGLVISYMNWKEENVKMQKTDYLNSLQQFKKAKLICKELGVEW